MTRIEKLKSFMSELSLDALYITHLPNIRYLTGFSGSSANLLLTAQKDYFISDFRYKDQAAQQVQGFQIIINYENIKELKRILENNGYRKIGFESTHLIYDDLESFKQAADGIEFVQLKNKVEEFTVQKTQEEIEKIKRAIEITDITFSRILDILKPGISELELSAEITYFQKSFGAEKDSFDPIVASGWRSALPHGIASDKKIQKGDAVTLDFGCVFQGFCSDLTSTVFIGEPSKELKKIYRIVLDAQQKAIDNAHANLSSKTLDSVARDYINRQGYGDYFGHGLGHGLGIEVHEQPGLNQRTDTNLKENSVVTIEPGIYVPSLGGVRIEDDILLQETGCIVLNHSPKELLIL